MDLLFDLCSPPGGICSAESWRTRKTFPIATQSRMRKRKRISFLSGMNISLSRSCQNRSTCLLSEYAFTSMPAAGSSNVDLSTTAPTAEKNEEMKAYSLCVFLEFCSQLYPQPAPILLGQQPPQSQWLTRSTRTGRAPSSRGKH